jgi:hypothetical protein
MAGQPAAPQLAISVLAAPPRRTETKKNRWPAAQNLCIPQQNLYIQPPPAAGLYIQLCIFLAVEGLCAE